MSKRALIASLALVAIIPLQATQVLALRDSKTVRKIEYPNLLSFSQFCIVQAEVACASTSGPSNFAGVCSWCHW